jgi:hypothetical protein
VVEESEGAYGVILHGARERSPALSVPVGYDSLLSNDRRWVVQLADEGGSEVGHLCAFPVGGGEVVDLTPERDPYVVRGAGFSADGPILAASVVDESGYHLLAIPALPWGAARVAVDQLLGQAVPDGEEEPESG